MFGLFRFRWLHRMIRKRMNPMTPEQAMNIKEKLSIAYMLIGWNALGAVFYLCYKGKKDWPEYYGLKTEEELNMKPSVYYARMLGVQRADIFTYKGFTKIDETEYVAPEEKHN